MDRILNAVILLGLENLTVKLIDDLKLFKVSSYLYGQLIICKRCESNINVR